MICRLLRFSEPLKTANQSESRFFEPTGKAEAEHAQWEATWWPILSEEALNKSCNQLIEKLTEDVDQSYQNCQSLNQEAICWKPNAVQEVEGTQTQESELEKARSLIARYHEQISKLYNEKAKLTLEKDTAVSAFLTL